MAGETDADRGRVGKGLKPLNDSSACVGSAGSCRCFSLQGESAEESPPTEKCHWHQSPQGEQGPDLERDGNRSATEPLSSWNDRGEGSREGTQITPRRRRENG